MGAFASFPPASPPAPPLPSAPASAQDKSDALRKAGAQIASYEWVALAILLLVGVGFRLAFPDRMAVEHFFEGVYATNIWFDSTVG